MDGCLTLKVIFIPCILVYICILTMAKKKEGVFWHCLGLIWEWLRKQLVMDTVWFRLPI